MIKSIDQSSFDEILQLASEGEGHRLEFKSASLLDLAHPHHGSGGKTTKQQLSDKVRTMFGSEAGAFANSGGGVIIFGIDDKTRTFDGSIPATWADSRAPIEDWVGAVLSESLSPQLSDFDCYSKTNAKKERIVVIDVRVSDQRPHQSVTDKKYYIRQGTKSVPADHWAVEALRNRAKHPQLRVELLLDQSGFHEYKKAHNQDQAEVYVILSLRVTNTGEVIANRWAISCACPFAKRPSLFQRGATKGTETPPIVNGSMLLHLETPLFPSQAADFNFQMHCHVTGKWNGEQFLDFTWFGLDKLHPSARGHATGDEDRWFNLNVTLHADSAAPVKRAIPIKELEFGPRLEHFIRVDSKRKIHLTENLLTQVNRNQRK